MKYNYLKQQGRDPQAAWVARPHVPVFLIGQKKTDAPFYALLDSGADQVLMPSDLGVYIGINNIKGGRREQTIGIASQSTYVYFHNIKIQLTGDARELSISVGFGDDILVPLLGRSFFKHFKEIVFRESKEEVELKY